MTTIVSQPNHYTEDYVLNLLMQDNESNFLGIHIGRIGRAKADAKNKLKNELREKYGSKWWLPGNYLKYRKDYKNEKYEVIQDAVSDAKRERFEEKEARKETKAERKDERKESAEERNYQKQLQRQNDLLQMQMQSQKNNIGTEAPEKDKEESKTGMFVAIGGLVLIVVVGVIVYFSNNN